jgi:hypothetical protein
MFDLQHVPAVSDEEIRESNTCDRCGKHDEDTVKQRSPERYQPDCSVFSYYTDDPTGPICDECYDPQTKLEKIQELLNKPDIDYVVEYECGLLDGVSDTYQPDKDVPDYRPQGWSPSVQLKHPKCQDLLDTVWTAEKLADRLSQTT